MNKNAKAIYKLQKNPKHWKLHMKYAQLVNLMTSTHQLCQNSSLYGHFMDRKVVSGTQSYTYKK